MKIWLHSKNKSKKAKAKKKCWTEWGRSTSQRSGRFIERTKLSLTDNTRQKWTSNARSRTGFR